MSTNKTTNLDLHSWVEADTFDMNEFNENFTAIDEAVGDLQTSGLSTSEKAQPNGLATLDSNGKVPDAQIPDSITRDTELSAHTNATAPHSDHVKGTMRITVGIVAPSDPAIGDIWFDTSGV